MYRTSTKNNNEAISAIAAHESVHGTDKENIMESISNAIYKKSYDVEKKTNEVERNVLRELFNQNNKLK